MYEKCRMKTKFVTCALITILLSACGTGLHVYSDFDKDANITDYKTYSWLTREEIEQKGTNPLYYNELNDKRIKQAVYDQMKKKGFTYKNELQPLEVHYHIVVEDKTVSISEPLEYVYGPTWPAKRTRFYPYQQGTLIIDLMDTKNKTLVWRGWATGAIEESVSKNPEQAIQKAVAKIFTLFPYQH